MNIGSRVKFTNKVLKTETDVPLGSIGILCDISDSIFATINGEELTHNVVFPSLSNNDYFNVAELEYLGEVWWIKNNLSFI